MTFKVGDIVEFRADLVGDYDADYWRGTVVTIHSDSRRLVYTVRYGKDRKAYLFGREMRRRD